MEDAVEMDTELAGVDEGCQLGESMSVGFDEWLGRYLYPGSLAAFGESFRPPGGNAE